MLDEPLLLRPGRPKDSAKRDEIVAAATDLFMQNGYELTSMEAVARQAGVSKLTIYSHFADKNELFRAIMQRRCDMLGMPEAYVAEAHLPVEQALLQIATSAMTKIYREDSIRLTRVIHAEAVRHPEVAQTYYQLGPQRVKTAFADLLRHFHRQEQIDIEDPIRATEQFFSILKGERFMRTLLMLCPPPTEEEIAAHAAATVAFFLNACRPKNNPPPETEKS